MIPRKPGRCALVALALALALAAAPAAAWEGREHETLADSCLAIVLRECRTAGGDAGWLEGLEGELAVGSGVPGTTGIRFGALSARSAERDGAQSRFQPRGRSVLDQLREVDAATLGALLEGRLPAEAAQDGAARGWPAFAPLERDAGGAAANFLVHHLIALRYAHLAGRLDRDNREALARALAYEAVALGYLSDAFASSHILSERPGLFGWLHPVNTAEARAFYRNHGAYVVDSRGQMWQTFGEKLLEWHHPTRDHVWDACATALRELFLVAFSARSGGALPESLALWAATEGLDERGREPAQWMETRDGAEYYAILRMPSLLRIPMATVASWSVRTDSTDAVGLRVRAHYPQLRETGLHDPSFEGIDDEFLLPRASVPDWLVLPRLASRDPRELIQSEPDVASVCFVQERHRKPSYKGGVWSVGLARTVHGPETGAGPALGIGYALVDEIVPVRRLPSMGRVSAELSYMPRVGGGSGSLVSPGVAIQLEIPRFPIVHIDTGYAWATEGEGRRHGPRTGIGLATGTIPLGFTFAGVMLRARYQWAFLGEIVGGPVIETVVH